MASLWIFISNIIKGQFYRVQVGVQSPEGITRLHGVLRRFNDFLKLFADVSLLFYNCFVLFMYLYFIPDSDYCVFI